MTSPKGFVVVFLLCVLALGYLFQHNWSLRLTRRITYLAKQRQMLCEKREQLRVEIDQLSSFARIESIWQSCRHVTAVSVRPDGDQHVVRSAAESQRSVVGSDTILAGAQ